VAFSIQRDKRANMAACNISQEKIEQNISFHGHTCPGIGIGIRAVILALERFSGYDPENLVAVVETDKCGVDAIQILTGCTFNS
jgi:formylmethanofuran dehydrogenase subunit E